MIKFIIKLAIVGLIANATWRVGMAYLSSYKFEDSVREAAQFRGRKTDEELRQRLSDLATEYDVPITAEDLTIKTQGSHYLIDGSYKRNIELVPGYTYPWPFTIHADIFVDTPVRPSEVLRPR